LAALGKRDQAADTVREALEIVQAADGWQRRHPGGPSFYIAPMTRFDETFDQFGAGIGPHDMTLGVLCSAVRVLTEANRGEEALRLRDQAQALAEASQESWRRALGLARVAWATAIARETDQARALFASPLAAAWSARRQDLFEVLRLGDMTFAALGASEPVAQIGAVVSEITDWWPPPARDLPRPGDAYGTELAVVGVAGVHHF
jgi:hypothetical protein